MVKHEACRALSAVRGCMHELCGRRRTAALARGVARWSLSLGMHDMSMSRRFPAKYY